MYYQNNGHKLVRLTLDEEEKIIDTYVYDLSRYSTCHKFVDKFYIGEDENIGMCSRLDRILD